MLWCGGLLAVWVVGVVGGGGACLGVWVKEVGLLSEVLPQPPPSVQPDPVSKYL